MNKCAANIQSFVVCRNPEFLDDTRAVALLQQIRDPLTYDLQNFPFLLDLIFTHSDDISQIPLGRSYYAFILFTFMAEITCQAVAIIRPNIKCRHESDQLCSLGWKTDS